MKVVEFPNTTAHMWIKPNAPYFAYPSSVIIGNGFAADGEWWMDTGSGVAFYGWGTTTNWAHMVVVYEGDVTQAKVYRDGVQIPLKRWVFDQTAFASGDYNTLHFSTTTWKPDNFSTNNLIDDVRVYDRALSPAEVGQLYQTESGNIDSDGDGLKDSVETNTGIWVSNSNTGTNPNNADTDGDGVLDGLEVLQGTDPTKDDRLKWKKVATEVNRADLLRTTEGVFHTNNWYSADGVNWQTTTYPPHSYWINASGYGGGLLF